MNRKTINITLSELQFFFENIALPSETKLTITFDDNAAAEMLKRRRYVEAMKKLRGSGNGNLVETLLRERRRDRLNEQICF